MSLSPLEEAEGRRIGSVEFVSPDEIKIVLDVDAPTNTALNTGDPRSFPRVNGYLLIPSDDGFVVGQIEWLAIERSPFPKRKGMQDYGLVDLPYPLRKIALNPVGTLTQDDGTDGHGNSKFKFRRGVYSFPTVGDSAVLPTEKQLRDIVESGENRRLLIGHAPLAGNAEVKIDPDRLFGRHLAVLGNTGSGKSCTVAGLIQWSVESARLARANSTEQYSSRFIVFDPNGEYTRSFSNTSGLKTYSVGRNPNPLKIPFWLWNSSEWCAFVQASQRAQKPILIQALRLLRNDLSTAVLNKGAKIAPYLRGALTATRIAKNQNDPFAAKDQKFYSFRDMVLRFGKSIQQEYTQHAGGAQTALKDLGDYAVRLIEEVGTDPPRNGTRYPRLFQLQEVDELILKIEGALSALGQDGEPTFSRGEDVPVKFELNDFIDTVLFIAQNGGNLQYAETLILRIKTLSSDEKMREVAVDESQTNLKDWLEAYLSNGKGDSVVVIDLSLVPTEIVHVLTAVAARLIFEALQRYRKVHSEGKSLPTTIVMEEAHTFIKRYKDDAEDVSAAIACCHVFERIAREGRKFGLGLVLSSQRPSELSPTVLSQCNSFILHRISNDKDQDSVGKLLPDHLRSVLRELPVLPTRHAFLLGWATELPILTQIRELPEKNQPQSQDPDFWSVWTGKTLNKDGSEQAVTREVNWEAIAKEWQQAKNEISSPDQISVKQSLSSPPEDDLPF